jgi:hypothetical protein
MTLCAPGDSEFQLYTFQLQQSLITIHMQATPGHPGTLQEVGKADKTEQ